MCNKSNNRRTRQKLSLLCVLPLYLIGFAAYAAALSFVDNGHPVKTIETGALVRNSELQTLTINNPTDSIIRSYQGISLIPLLDAVFDPQWKTRDAIKLTSSDGYQPIIPVRVILKYDGMIAIGENGRRGFSPLARNNGETVDPGPFFLVWENIQDVAAKKESWLSWPWQLTTIELTSFEREYPHSSPPPASHESVKKGFLAFRQHCMKCHAINGDGGDIGPELNYPVSVTEYWQPEWLIRFIADPQSVRANSKMIPFYRDVDNRPELIADIIEYLKAMTRKKPSNR
jgi:cytochrome c2